MLNNKMNVDVARLSIKPGIKLSIVLFALTLSACSHQSKVKPSTGHIDGKVNTNNASPSSASGQQNNTNAPIPKLVKSAPQLPPPKATTKAQTYSVVVNEVSVKEILFALARESKLNIDIHPSIQGRAT